MKSWVVLVITAVAGGLGGFLIGKTKSSSESTATPSVVEGAGLLSGGDQGSGKVSAGPARQTSTAGGMNRNNLRRELNSIKRDPNPISRFASLTKLLGDLSKDNLSSVHAAFNEIPMRQEHREEYQMLIYAWAGFDPEAALKFVDENANSRSIKKNDLLNPLIASWASQDPDATLEWINALPEAERSSQLMAGLMKGWATIDPYAAAEYLQANVKPGKDREKLAGEIASHLFKQDPSDAAKWAESQADLRFRAEAFEELAEDWASVDPIALAGWLGEHAEEEYSAEAFQDLARAWVSENPSAATEYFEGLPDGVAKETGIYEMAVTWGKDDLGALGEWLNGLPDSNVTDLGVKAYVNRLAKDSPQAAIDSALSITGDEVRNETVQDLGQNWFRQDPEAATAWASANGVPVETFQSKDDTIRMVINGEEIEVPTGAQAVQSVLPSLGNTRGNIGQLKDQGIIIESVEPTIELVTPQ
ncbi:hypothetical protein N9260_00815 [bacterium]|nr:hypothetical protein [bacterium]